MSWNYGETEGGAELSAEQTDEEFQTAEITVPGMVWTHLQVWTLTIYVKFDHECLVRQPDHTLCFPQVGACGRELILPVSHMKDEESFRQLFIAALFKGHAFSRP